MGFIDLGANLDDIPEQNPVPEGNYDLIIEGSKLNPANMCINVWATVSGEPEAATVFHNLSLPKADDDDEKKKNKLRFLKAFLQKFKIPYGAEGFNEEDLIGARANCHLIQDEYQGRISNKIKL